MLGEPASVSITDGRVSAQPLGARSRQADSPDKYIEDTLQQIIDVCPGVLAVKEFLPAARSICPLGREIPVDLAGKQGLIDNLLDAGSCCSRTVSAGLQSAIHREIVERANYSDQAGS
jgi:hypothetical protein